ncbi:hypothetical protein POM88_052072 [Heracleum sosnowskyi]|uniref:Uncharacterized protein n=1 Tax=Heracleum sosnowskyi TaxID=360622 RepID=A0AAD8GRA8_9APIA|nr:hypothetical protein POM88_052072 [Heracleum sosnowskyi]
MEIKLRLFYKLGLLDQLVKRLILSFHLPHCKNTINVQHLQHGTVFVRPRDLQLEGNWIKQDTFIELLESFKFKVSGKLLHNRRGFGFCALIKSRHAQGAKKSLATPRN